MDQVHAYEEEIGGYLYERLAAVEGVTIYGPPPSAARGRASLAAFNVEGLHATDVSTLLDNSGEGVLLLGRLLQLLLWLLLWLLALFVCGSKARVLSCVRALAAAHAFFFLQDPLRTASAPGSPT
jgi:hypothetical protein